MSKQIEFTIDFESMFQNELPIEAQHLLLKIKDLQTENIKLKKLVEELKRDIDDGK